MGVTKSESGTEPAPARVPVLLLKTKSTPNDSYQEVLSSTTIQIQQSSSPIEPVFVPVLRHSFDNEALQRMRSLLDGGHIGNELNCKYGGLIFTSQRAVEAFGQVISNAKASGATWPLLATIPIYTVGPATTRAVKSVLPDSSLQVFGDHTGNGEALAEYMLVHYREWYKDRSVLPSLLFFVGEQRRDIIPRTLMNPDLPDNQRINVDEDVVYGTGVMETFPSDFRAALTNTSSATVRWVVVFSPTGCDAMLRELDVLDQATNKAKSNSRDGKTFIATIGPTTKAHLLESFGFEPDVCAKAPSPEGIVEGIRGFTIQRS